MPHYRVTSRQFAAIHAAAKRYRVPTDLIPDLIRVVVTSSPSSTTASAHLGAHVELLAPMDGWTVGVIVRTPRSAI